MKNIDREIDNPENYKCSIFYFNPKDKRVIVQKQDRYRGWTLNFGNINTYLIIASVLLAVCLYNFF